MGGNSRYIDRATGKDLGFAEKIDLTKVNRTDIVKEITSCLKAINKEYFTDYKTYLWNDFSVITNGSALNGSSSSLFNTNITDKEFVSVKSSVGDIDVTFPEKHMENLWHLLNRLENTQLSKSITYLGHKNSTIDETKAGNLNQINAVFKLDLPSYSTNIQIDFEASHYEDDKPTKWASFSHNSDWDDIKNGYKGVMHKYILINLSRASSKMNGAKVVTKSQIKKLSDVSSKEYQESVDNNIKSKLAKVSVQKDFINPTNLAFSVDRGMRVKFSQIFHNDGEPALIDGKPVFSFIEPKDSKYETNLETMFSLIFNKEPNTEDMRDFHSFVGVVKLIKKYLKKDLVEDFFITHLIKKSLFAKGAQGLERNNPEGDLKIKNTMINKLYNTFDYLKRYKEEVDEISNKYYEGYRMYDLNEDELTVNGGKLSDIFEQVTTVVDSVIEPSGWKHFDSKRLAEEKVKVLKKFDLSNSEIINFMNSMPNSRNVNDTIRKINPKRGLEDFLRYSPTEKTVSQQMIDRMLKRGY